MRDEIDARLWVEYGAGLSNLIHDGLASARHTFERLAAIQFAAPWSKKARFY